MRADRPATVDHIVVSQSRIHFEYVVRLLHRVIERTETHVYLAQHMYLCSSTPEKFKKKSSCGLEHHPTGYVQENASTSHHCVS
jgi:hypothetical protein